MAKSKNYDADAIEWYRGLEGVRKKVSMYLGSSDGRAMTHCVKEIAVNSLDEASNGHASFIHLLMMKDGTVIVQDDGRGIPIGPHPKDRSRDTLTILATELHSGGKMTKESGNYKNSLGVHGIGMAAVNAVSDPMIICSYRNNVWNCQEFRKGIAVRPKPVPQKKLPITGIKDLKRGTVIAFKCDPTVFEKGSKIERRPLLAWIDEMAWLTPCRFKIEVEGRDPIEVHRPDGLTGRFDYECSRLKLEPALSIDPFVLHTENVDIMVGWAASIDTLLMSSVSGSKTPAHGTHVTGFTRGLKAGFERLRKKGDNFTIDSLQTGMIAVVNVKLAAPEFSSQDKVRLVSAEGGALIEAAMVEHFDKWVGKNKTALREIIERANEQARLSSEFKASSKLAAAVKTTKRGKSLLPIELKGCQTDDPDKRELFVVEGSSALGTAIDARDPQFQELLGLKGKIINVLKSNEEKIMKSVEALNLLKSLGFIAENPTKSRVGKIILLADADEDGQHIEALILTLLIKYMPYMFDSGRVYRVDAPLYFYRTEAKEGIKAATYEALKAKVGPKFDSNRVTRMKGWGEANADLLRGIALDPATRKIQRIVAGKAETRLAEIRRVVGIMGQDTDARRTLLDIQI